MALNVEGVVGGRVEGPVRPQIVGDPNGWLYRPASASAVDRSCIWVNGTLSVIAGLR